MSAPTTRRELSKARTRDALLDATRELTAQRGLGEVTAEEIAAHAGVSRRTFFNYFTGIDAAIAEGTSQSLEAVAAAFLARPAQEDPLTAVINALRECPFDERLPGWLAAVGCAGDPPAHIHLQIWHHHREWLAELLTQRLGEAAEPLHTATLAGAVMSIFEAAELTWIDGLTSPDIDQADVTRLNELMLRGLRYARDGWVVPAPYTT